jgi:hypothetical protein
MYNIEDHVIILIVSKSRTTFWFKDFFHQEILIHVTAMHQFLFFPRYLHNNKYL